MEFSSINSSTFGRNYEGNQGRAPQAYLTDSICSSASCSCPQVRGFKVFFWGGVFESGENGVPSEVDHFTEILRLDERYKLPIPSPPIQQNKHQNIPSRGFQPISGNLKKHHLQHPSTRPKVLDNSNAEMNTLPPPPFSLHPKKKEKYPQNPHQLLHFPTNNILIRKSRKRASGSGPKPNKKERTVFSEPIVSR